MFWVSLAIKVVFWGAFLGLAVWVYSVGWDVVAKEVGWIWGVVMGVVEGVVGGDFSGGSENGYGNGRYTVAGGYRRGYY